MTARLTQTDLDAFLTQLSAELGATLERGPSLRTNAYRVWLTLLDDATGGSLRIRKLTMAMIPEPGSTLPRRSREWFSTSAAADGWAEIDNDEELASDALLAIVRAAVARHCRGSMMGADAFHPS